MIPALVLTAGIATRLRPLSLLRAKAALPVAGEPLVHRILRQLAVDGVTDAVLNLHHLPQTISGVVGDGSGLGLRVRYSWENPVLGSAGGPRRALRILGESPFLVINGDTLCDVDVRGLVAAHQSSGALLTMAVVPQAEPEKYGSVMADANGVVTALVPRGTPGTPGTPGTQGTPGTPDLSPFHFLSIYVADAAAFEGLTDGRPSEFRDVIGAHPGRVRVHVLQDAEFLDIGTVADYLATSLLLAQREGRSPHCSKVRIAPSAAVTESVLWDDVTVDKDATVHGCVVCDGVTVPAGTHWRGMTLRRALGEPAPNERRDDQLFVAPL